jgi:hypothetical protein
VKPRDDIGWETHTQRCKEVFSVSVCKHSSISSLLCYTLYVALYMSRDTLLQVCHRTFQFSYRYMSMKQRRVYRSNLEVVRLFPPLSDSLRNELSRIRYSYSKFRTVLDCDMPTSTLNVTFCPPSTGSISHFICSVAVMRLFWRVRIGVDLVRCEFIKDYTGRLLLIKVCSSILQVPHPFLFCFYLPPGVNARQQRDACPSSGPRLSYVRRTCGAMQSFRSWL